jgi:nitrogen regulatory protein PII
MTIDADLQLKTVRRIEIITPSVELRKVLEILDSLQVKGYSILRNVSGKGDRGTTACDVDLDGACNDYVLAVCDAEQEQQVLAAMRPILQRYGGVCLSSEAQWLLHSGPNW